MKSFLSSLQNLFSASSRDKELKVGQVWRYKTRKGEAESRAIVLKIEDTEDLQDAIVHFKVTGLNIQAGSGDKQSTISELGHIPLMKSIVSKELIKVSGSTQVSLKMLDGYREWSLNEGGIFALGLSDSISLVESGINRI